MTKKLTQCQIERKMIEEWYGYELPNIVESVDDLPIVEIKKVIS